MGTRRQRNERSKRNQEVVYSCWQASADAAVNKQIDHEKEVLLKRKNMIATRRLRSISSLQEMQTKREALEQKTRRFGHQSLLPIFSGGKPGGADRLESPQLTGSCSSSRIKTLSRSSSLPFALPSNPTSLDWLRYSVQIQNPQPTTSPRFGRRRLDPLTVEAHAGSGSILSPTSPNSSSSTTAFRRSSTYPHSDGTTAEFTSALSTQSNQTQLQNQLEQQLQEPPRPYFVFGEACSPTDSSCSSMNSRAGGVGPAFEHAPPTRKYSAAASSSTLMTFGSVIEGDPDPLATMQQKQRQKRQQKWKRKNGMMKQLSEYEREQQLDQRREKQYPVAKDPTSPTSALMATKLGAGQYINNVWRWSSSSADVRLRGGHQ